MGKKQQPKQKVTQDVPKVEKPIFKTKVEEYFYGKRQRVNLIKEKIAKKVTFDQKTIKKAISELLKYRTQQKQGDLLDIKDDFIYLEIVLNRVPIKYSIRPIQLEVPHPIYSQEMNSKFCIISTDPQRAFKDRIQDFDIPLIQKVIGFTKLKKNYVTYADKRKLNYEYDLFFCEKSIYSIASQQLGKVFYDRKKIPFPLEDDVSEEGLNKLSKYTYFIQGNGPVYTVKIGRAAQSTEQISQNLMSVVYEVLGQVMQEKGMSLSCLRSLSLKLSNSISLPFYTRLSVREVEVYKKLK